MLRYARLHLLSCLFLALVAGRIQAQSNDEIQTGTQFNFSTPGARSLGLGGAFLGAADDATAAYTNPAGLTQLVRPEVSFEGRHWRTEARFADRGHAPVGGLTGRGIDIVDGLEMASRESETNGLSFLSYVHSFDRLSLALYRHELANFAASLQARGAFVGRRDNAVRLPPVVSSYRLRIDNVGLAAGYRLSDHLSLGASLAVSRFELDSRTERFLVVGSADDASLGNRETGRFYGPADFDPARVFSVQTQRGRDQDVAATLGWLWQPAPRWSLGGVWRQGPDFGFEAAFLDRGPGGDVLDPALSGEGVFRVPDVWGVGATFRPSDATLVSLDWNRVEYSDMTEDLLNVLRAHLDGSGRFVVDDADEIRLGFEYQRLSAHWPWSARLGAWWDPDHRIRYEGPKDVLAVRFRAGDDQLHLAAGFGLVFDRLQLDLAADVAERSATFSLSAVVRLGRSTTAG